MRVVVTGASSGIGRELSRLFCLEKKASVVGVGRDTGALGELRRELGECFYPVVADLSTLSGVETVVNEASKFLGGVDVLVNNAGLGFYKKITEHSTEELVSEVMVNFVAPLVLTGRLLPLMRPGSIVVFVITAGVYVLMESLPVYGAAKAGLHYAVKALRRELRSRGIHVLAVYPGVVKTRFHERAGVRIERGEDPSKVAHKILRAIDRKQTTLHIPRYLALTKILACIQPPVKTAPK